MGDFWALGAAAARITGWWLCERGRATRAVEWAGLAPGRRWSGPVGCQRSEGDVRVVGVEVEKRARREGPAASGVDEMRPVGRQAPTHRPRTRERCMQQGRVKEAIDKSPPAVAKGNFQAEEWQRAVPYRGGIGGRRVKFKRTKPPFPGLPVPGQVDQWVSRAKARWSVGEMGFEKNGHQLKETKDRSGPWPRAQEVQTLEVSISMPCATTEY